MPQGALTIEYSLQGEPEQAAMVHLVFKLALEILTEYNLAQHIKEINIKSIPVEQAREYLIESKLREGEN